MEKEIGWKATEEEEVPQDVGDGLEIRRRKKGKMGKENEEKLVNGEENSVYFAAEKGVWKCRHCTWTYHLSGPGIDLNPKREGNCRVTIDVETLTQLGTYVDTPIKGVDAGDVTVGLKFDADRDKQNGEAKTGAKFNDRKNVSVEEQNHGVKNAVSENGSDFYLGSGKKSSNGITRNENEILESEQLKPGDPSELVVEEFDVERVLEEQGTHDLYCPVCRSCITKRVILRKRKRPRRESQSVFPPEKIQHVAGDVSAPSEPAYPEDERVFRCLSCFSFFIPTEGGFNIFRIFGKKEGNINLQSSEKLPATKANWISSLFGSAASKANGTEAGVPLLAESTVESGTASRGDPSLYLNQNFPQIPTSEARDLGSNTGINNEDPKVGANHGRGEKGSYPETTRSEGNATYYPDVMVKPPFAEVTSPNNEDFHSSAASHSSPDTGTSIDKPASPIPEGPEAIETVLNVGVQGIEESRRGNEWDVLKSIVYGGLMESIASLSVVASAAGSGTSTLKIVALGLANLVSGLFVISHDISELRSAHDTRSTNQRDEHASQYYQKLGKRENFRRHVAFSILSYIIFGFLPPVVYGFAFRKSDNKEYKLVAVAASSMLCVTVLAIGKAHVRPQKDYIKSLLYYIGLALLASGLSYAAGVTIDRLFAELGVFDHGTASPSPPSSVGSIRFGSGASTWAAL